jgi:hypothetical protein
VVKLELLPSDAPYSRPSNLQQPFDVENLELRLPVIEKPGSGGGVVQEPQPPVIPPGYQPAIGYPAAGGRAVPIAGASGAHGRAGLAKGRIRATKKRLILPLLCKGAPCSGSLTVSRGKRKLAGGPYEIPGGATQKLRLPLTKAGRKFVAKKRAGRSKKKTFKARLSFADAGQPIVTLSRPVHLGK